MARSLTFIAEGDVRTLVSVTDNGDGTLDFEVQVVGDVVGDLRAVFFDLQGLTVAEGDLYVTDAADVATDGVVSEEGSVDRISKDANIKGSVSNDLGDFDVGIEFGTSGIGADDIQSTTFTLASQTTDLTLDMVSFADFGLRYTSVGEDGSDRDGSAKIGDTSGGVAADDVVSLVENTAKSVNLTANDAALGAVLAQTVVLQTAAGVFGTVEIASDGTATVTADGPAADALNTGDSATFLVEYTVVNGDDAATATLTITIEGEDDVVGLFTEGVDVVDFATVLAGDYTNGTQYAALGGNDVVVLAGDAAAAAAAGFDPGQTFDGGAGEDSIQGGALDDIIAGGADGDVIDTGTGADTAFGGDGDDRILVDGFDGSDHVDGGAGTDTLVFALADGALHNVRFFPGQPNEVDGVGVSLIDVEAFEITGGDQRDVITTGDGNDVLHGGGGNDQLSAQGGDNSVFGGDGSDEIAVREGNHHLDGGAGINRVSFASSTVDFVIDLSTDVATGSDGSVSTILNFTHATAFFGDDTLIGDAGHNDLAGNNGSNTLYGGAGNDNFAIQNNSTNCVDGGIGLDRLSIFTGNATHTDFTTGISEIIGGNSITEFTNIFQVLSGNNDNTVIGDDNDQQLILAGGTNSVSAAGGNDLLEGTTGTHIFDGGDGFDTFFWNVPGNVTVDLTTGSGTGAGTATLSNVEQVSSGGGDDSLFGSAGTDALSGGFGNDHLDGRGGDDTVSGGVGDDTIIGGTGDDELFGGPGDDLFIFAPGSGADRIVGFVAGAGTEDVLDVSAYGFASEAAVIGATTNEVGGAVIDLDGLPGGDQITLHGVVVSQLDADDFIV